MVEYEKDCILFKLNKPIQINNNTFFSTPKNLNFESFEAENLNINIKKIVFTWLDPVRIRNKIITRDQVNVVFIYFENLNILACFGSSESYISYAINKLERKLKIPHFTKLDIFNFCKKTILENRSWIIAKFTGIHVYDNKKSLYDCEIDDLKRISVKSTKYDELKSYINSENLESFTFKSNKHNVYFYIDKQSVLSFPDTVKEDVVVNVLSQISETVL